MEVFCLVLEFREEKRAFAKIEGGNVDFFFFSTSCISAHQAQLGYKHEKIKKKGKKKIVHERDFVSFHSISFFLSHEILVNRFIIF
jgi:hypothetical protein